MQKQRAVLDAWVDWLAAELLAPFDTGVDPKAMAPALAAQADLVERMQTQHHAADRSTGGNQRR